MLKSYQYGAANLGGAIAPLPSASPESRSYVYRLRRLLAAGRPFKEVKGTAMAEAVFAWAEEVDDTIERLNERIHYLEGLSNTDELTGLLNRRGFHSELRRGIALSQRSKETGLLLLCDLDHFKSINDRYGHLAGDKVLRAVGELLGQRTRRSDSVGRLGGDEFAVLMTQSKPSEALRRVARLEARLNTLLVPWEDIEIPVSASVGTTTFKGNVSIEALFQQADQALYEQKQPSFKRAVGAD